MYRPPRTPHPASDDGWLAPNKPGGGADILPFIPRARASEDLTRVELLARIAGLEHKLASLPVIEQAKGSLMLTYGLSADAAFEMLRFHSMHRNIKINALACTIAGLLPAGPTTAAATSRFDRLLDQAADDLQAPISTSDGPPARSGVSAAPSPAAGPAPAVIIAGNTPQLPLIYANDAFTTLTGYPKSEILGRNCRFLQGPDTSPRDVARLGRALRAGDEVTVVLRNYRKDGSAFWNEVSISPLQDPAGQITHYIGTQTDLGHS